MTDQKNTAPSDNNDTLTVSSLNQLEEVPSASNATFSLGKLEDDLRMLHVKWQAVEGEISERDEQIESLRQEIDEYHKRCNRLESDDRLKKLEAQNIELIVQKQELQDYIDGRKNDWDNLNTQIKEYEDTIRGMSDDLAAHESVVADKEDEKAALALKVMELERDFSSLQGRHSEKESNNAELQQMLEDQSRELGSLNGDTIRLRKDIEKMQEKLERRDETIESLRRELKDSSKDSSTLENLLSDEQSTIAELRLKLTIANERIEELTADQQVRATELQLALRANETKEQPSSDDAGQLEILAAELQAELLEVRANFHSVEEELEAQRELVETLERDLSNKQKNLDSPDESIDRMSALGSGIRELDMQIDDMWLKQPKEAPEAEHEIFENPDEVLIAPEDLFDLGDAACEHLIVANDEQSGEEISYPLSGKDMTIGRSPRCDIHLRSKYISRIHAKVRVEGSSATIEDAGSMNGFFVNSVQTRRHTLADGDELEIGESKFRYVHN
ncbi:MAG: FHA domain-containing protein [Woeseiaceae bacterium]